MKKGMIWTAVLCFIVLSLEIGAPFAWAKYPERKIRIVCPFEAGGGTDVMARALARFANPYLGGKLYVENVTGGGGIIGAREGLKAEPDGYTLVMLATTNAVAPHVVKDYPPVDLFDPICITALDPMILAVSPDSPFKTPNDIIAYARANPGKLTGGTSGYGGPNHFVLAAFGNAIGGEFSYVPFKGSAPALLAAAGKHVDLASAGGAEALTLAQGNKIKVLISFSAERSPIFPQVPTAKELGYNVVVSRFMGISAGKGVAQDVRAVLIHAFKKAMENEEFKKFIVQTGQIPVFVSDQDARTWLKGQSDTFKAVADRIGIKPE
jgi:tripartite-type tricarboxylate transporter receptor subunit TctC